MSNLSANIDWREKKSLSTALARKRLARMFFSWWRQENFDGGNGDKILKRCLTLARRTNLNLPYDLVLEIVRGRPSCREAAFAYLCRGTVKQNQLNILSRVITSNFVVDEMSSVESVSRLLESRIHRSKENTVMYRKMIESLIENDGIKRITGFWLAARVLPMLEVPLFYEQHVALWRANRNLGRLVGSLRPLFVAAGELSEFERLIRNSRNEEAFLASSFQEQLGKDVKAFRAVRDYVRAPNPTKPSGISFPKALLLFSAFQNEDVSNTEKLNLINIHSTAWKDPILRFYARKSLPKDLRSKF